MMDAAAVRLAEVREGIESLRTEITTWIAGVRDDGVEGAHTTQLATLDGVFSPTLDAIADELRPRADDGLDLGGAYEAARRTDKRVIFCRRLFRWYASRVDQRRSASETAETRACLRAADEVIWSTWARTFKAAGVPRPPAPLPFIDNDAVPWASFHDVLPAETQPPAVDPFFKDRIHELPIPVIGLPPLVGRRPWWLVVAIHEAGHHVQHVLDDELVAKTEAALRAAAVKGGGRPAEAQQWADWSGELFADAFAAAFAGEAFVRVLEELERSRPSELVQARPTYPPAVVRLQVAVAVTVAAGGAAPDVTLADPTTPVDEAKVAGLTARVNCIAGALLDLPLGQTTLRAVAPRGRDRAEAQARWAQRFAPGAPDPQPVQSVEAAVECVSGAVEAWRAHVVTSPAPDPEALRQRVLGVLPLCRVDGDRAGAPPVDQAAAALIAAVLDPDAPL